MAENEEKIDETTVTGTEAVSGPVIGDTAEVMAEPVSDPVDITVKVDTEDKTQKSGKTGKHNKNKSDEKSADKADDADTQKVDESAPKTDEATDKVDEPADKADDADEQKVDEPATTTKVVNSHRKFDVRFSYSTDTRGISGKKSWSAVEIVEQYVAAPSCFIGVSTEEDLKNLKADIKAVSLKVLDKDGKKVEFSAEAKKQLIGRIEEHSDYLISKK